MSPIRRKLSIIAHWGFAAFGLYLVVSAIARGKIHARQLAKSWPFHDILRADDPGQFWFCIFLFLAVTCLLVWNGLRIYLNKIDNNI